jgi:hypothetical protein
VDRRGEAGAAGRGWNVYSPAGSTASWRASPNGGARRTAELRVAPGSRPAWRRRVPASSARRRATGALFEGDRVCWSGNDWTLLETETRPRPVDYRRRGFVPNRTCNGRRRPAQRPWTTMVRSREVMAMTVKVLAMHAAGHGATAETDAVRCWGPPARSARRVPCKMKSTNGPCST